MVSASGWPEAPAPAEVLPLPDALPLADVLPLAEGVLAELLLEGALLVLPDAPPAAELEPWSDFCSLIVWLPCACLSSCLPAATAPNDNMAAATATAIRLNLM
jgi:hypothetical protein